MYLASFFLAAERFKKRNVCCFYFFSPLGLTQYFFGQDYWHPVYIFGNSVFGFEDILYMFAVGGILGVIYEEFFGKRLSKRHTRSHPYIMLLFSVLGLSALFVGTMIFHINSLYVSSFIFLFIGILTISIRHDLLKHALYSGVCLGALTFVFNIFFIFLFPDIFQSWWSLDNISGILLVGIPVEEVIFASMLGFVGGPMYEFVFGLRLKK